MDLLPELLKQGLLGLFGAIFLWFYIQERKDHKNTQNKLEAQMEARRQDSLDRETKLIETLSDTSQSVNSLTDKILVARGEK